MSDNNSFGKQPRVSLVKERDKEIYPNASTGASNANYTTQSIFPQNNISQNDGEIYPAQNNFPQNNFGGYPQQNTNNFPRQSGYQQTNMSGEIYTSNHIQQGINPPAKYCQYCGAQIPADAVVCSHCGRQVAELRQAQPQVIISNTMNGAQQAPQQNLGVIGRPKDKWVAVILCLLLGTVGGHKFYEGKVGIGVLYILTIGLFGIGVIIDLITLLCKPNPYYVL